jgi:hypothetical protein
MPRNPDPFEPMMNGIPAVEFIKGAYGLLPHQTARFDMGDPVQTALRRVKDWITMAEADALNEDPRRAKGTT